MASENRIDSIYDVAAISAEQKRVEELVRASIEQIKAARSQSIDLNANAKGFEEYSKKAKELEKSLASVAKASDAATKSSILLSKQKEAEAKAAERVAKQALAETRAREANEKAAQREAAAIQKANAAKGDLKSRPISSIPSEIKTGDVADPNASQERVNQLEREQAALDSAAVSEGNYGAAKLKSADATQKATNSVVDELSPLQQNILLRENLKNKIAEITKKQKEDNALFRAGTITKAEYNKRLIDSQTRLAVYKTKVQELNRVVKEDIALEGRAGDAYKQLSAEYNKAALAAKNYQVELGKNNPTTIAAVANAKKLGDELKSVDAAVGQNQRNVGNYTKGITQAFGKLWGFLRTAANIIPGLGIGGLIGGIAIGIGKLATMIFASNKAFDEGKISGKAYADTIKEVTEETVKNSNVDISKLQLYRDIITDTTAKQEDRMQALRAYNKIADDSNKIDESQINNLNLINDKISQQISLIEKRAFSRAAEAIIADRGEKLLLAQLTAREEAEKQFANEQSQGMKVAGKAVDEYFTGLEKQSRISTIIRGKEAVKTAQIEFDAAKNALRNLIDVEGFAADEIKATKEKAAKKGRDLAEANRKAEFEILKNSIQLDLDFQKDRLNNEKLSYEERLKALVAYTNRSQQLIDVTAQFELGAAGKTRTEKLKIESDKNAALIRLARETSKELQKIIEGEFNTGTDNLPIDSKIPKELQKILDDFDKAQKKAIKDAADNAKKLKEAFRDAFIGLASELEGLFFDIFTNTIEAEKNAIQDQIDLLDQQKQKDIEVANQTITNAQDKADAIAVIEARAAAKKQQLELKQRQLDQQKARFEKARAVTEIVQNTSIAVVKALGQFPGPVGIALAAVIGALGAVQIARVLAQPIPRYKDGTQNHPGGLAVVGDGGKSETVVLPDGSLYRTPSKDTLVNMPAGSQVIPDYQGRPQTIGMVQPVDNTDKLLQGFNSVVYAIKRIPQPIIKADRAWTQAHKIGSSYRNYLNRSI